MSNLSPQLCQMPEYRGNRTVRASMILEALRLPAGGSRIVLAEPPGMTIEVDDRFIECFSPRVGGFLIYCQNGDHLAYAPLKVFSKRYTRVRGESLQGIAVVQWFKNGDHPLDYSKAHTGLDNGQMRDFSPDERKANQWEGDIVRYYRTPDVQGESVCDVCSKTMHVHGWIEARDGGHVVCPGDWIVTDANGGHYPTKQDPAGDIDLNAADFSDALMWLKEGKRVQRAGWNGNNQFVVLVKPGFYDVGSSTGAKAEALQPFLALKNAQDMFQPGWVPSMGDLMATDWMVVA